MLPKGSFKVDQTTDEADSSLVNIFHSDCKFACGRNYYEMFILSNGALFISEPLLTEVLCKSGVEGLVFLILTQLGHIINQDILRNLEETHRYGDLKK